MQIHLGDYKSWLIVLVVMLMRKDVETQGIISISISYLWNRPSS